MVGNPDVHGKNMPKVYAESKPSSGSKTGLWSCKVAILCHCAAPRKSTVFLFYITNLYFIFEILSNKKKKLRNCFINILIAFFVMKLFMM